jgi:hypothetical protein
MARFAFLALATLALAACKPAEAPTPDPEADPIARQFFDEVRSGADLDGDPHLAHELKNPTTYDQIAEFRALIPAETPRSVELRSSDVTVDSTGTTTRIAEIYHYSDRDLLAQTALFKSPSGVEPVIVGFRISETEGGG